MSAPSEIPGWTEEEDRFLDKLDRVSWRVARCFALGLPVWLLLLLFLPLLIPFLTPLSGLMLATLGAGLACWAMERGVSRRRRRAAGAGPDEDEPETRRRSGSARLVIAGAIALFVIYGVVVIFAGGGR
ncbi:MAG: hypothetical protein QOD86_2228 [Miltoncostaeaceae bacterium]|jgi:hypothetical protein|nr:hypothetical protein [Miltoncostaeaceae bacterium]